MNLTAMLRRVEKLAVDNSPVILTGLGVAGTITTAFLTGKASFRAAQRLEDARYIRSVNRTGVADAPFQFTLKEKVNLVWKDYIPPVATGVITITSIIFANRIGTRRAAALAAAYSLSERAASEYKEKVVEMVGKAKETKIRDEVAKDKVAKNPPPANGILVIDGGDVLVHEAFTGRYFRSSMEALRKAQNDVNEQIIQNNYASLTDFYNYLDVPATEYSDEVGWNVDKLMEMTYSYTSDPDGRPCLSFSYDVVPIRNYFRLH